MTDFLRSVCIIQFSSYVESMSAYRTEMEEARLQLSEGLLRLWEQSDLVDGLFQKGLPTEEARDLLSLMQQTIEEMRLRVEFLLKTIVRSS